MTERTVEITPEKAYLLKKIKLMLTLNITLYSIDEFKSDPQYYLSSKKFRNKIDTAEKAIEWKANEGVEDIFSADEKLVQSKLKEYEQIAKLIAEADFDDLTAIHEGLIKYFKEKNNTLCQLQPTQQ